MRTAILNLKALQNDCNETEHEFGESLEVLSVLDGKKIDILLSEEEYYAMIAKMVYIAEDGDIFGIDWEKYDYATVSQTDEDGEPTEFYSFRESWLNINEEDAL